MKYFIGFIFFLICFFTSCNNHSALEKSKIQILDSYLDSISVNNLNAGTISIFEDGKEIYCKTFGPDELSSERYQIGSISKMFTAIMLWQLEQSGVVDLEDPLNNYFPMVSNAENISLKNLLNHKSGLQDFLDKIGGSEEWLFEFVGDNAIMDEIIFQGVAFQPDSAARYSNSGYYLLSQILQRVKGSSYDKILSELITTPLNLKSFISASSSEYFESDIADSYLYEDGKWKTIRDFDFRNVVGVGDLVCSMSDMNYFLYALFEGAIIPQNTLSAILPPDGIRYGYGLMAMPFRGHIFYGHGGDTMGSHSLAMYEPSSKLSISYCVNGTNMDADALALRIYSILF